MLSIQWRFQTTFIEGPCLIFSLLIKDDGFINIKDLIESYKHSVYNIIKYVINY